MTATLWRVLVVTHRYLGIAVGLLMMMWFASGIVMMYVGYPRPSDAERLRALAPIEWQTCCRFADGLFGESQQFAGAQLESLLGMPVLRLRRPPLPDQLIDLAQGTGRSVDADDAKAIALDAASHMIGHDSPLVAAETIERDQWTVGLDAGGELYRFTFGDADGSILYIGGSGRMLLRTTASQRFWNWLGAIPHWLYLAALRADVRLWSRIVIWASVLGTFLSVLGLGLGIAQFRRGKSRTLSPYRGLFYWHHLAGLVFGIVTLTFVFSGLVSMNPWGLLESRRGGDTARITGPPPKWSEIRSSLLAMRPQAAGMVSLSARPLAGGLYWLATDHDGTVSRLDATGGHAPMAEKDLAAAAARLAGANEIASHEFISQEDAYYFSHHDQIVLPAYRVVLNDADHTRYYLDPVSGALLQRADANGRWHRWLFAGLHRLDFTAALRARPAWDIVMLTLLVGGMGVVATGLYLAVRRVRADVARLLRFVGKARHRNVAARAR
jgi:hypothetical protein